MIAELPGARIWYEDSGGGGVPVVFLHAATGSSRVWIHQFPAFTAAGYRCIAPDRRGHGRSAARPGTSPGTAAEDLDALLSHLGLGKIHLLGTAAGGIVAFDYALSFPQRLRSLVIANSIGGVQDQDYLDLMRRLRPSPQFDALPAEIRELGPSYRAANAEGTRQWVELEHLSTPDRKPAPKQPMRNRIAFAALETLRMPTLLLTGDADLYTPPPVLELFGKRIGSSTSVIVPACGHSAYWEQPDFFNRAVLEFLAKY